MRELKPQRHFWTSQYTTCKYCGKPIHNRRTRRCRDCFNKQRMQKAVDVDFWNSVLKNDKE